MNIKDREKLERLRHIFDLNYRLTRLYADYLSIYPEIINENIVKELTKDSEINEREAIIALLSEIFSLDYENGGDERTLIRDYISKSVTLKDGKKYKENPYYKNIKIPEIKDGDWEFKHECYSPYRAIIVGDMLRSDDFSEYPPLGFFTEEFTFPAVLEGGNEWMTLTPVDIDTSDEAIAAARGKIVTFGLGLGYYAYMVSEKPEVSSITVVEKSPDVIRLFERYILPQFPHREKVKIINADAFEYAEKTMPKEHFDLAFVDTWRDASDGAPMYEKMKRLEHLSPDTKFLYWIENFLISRLTALKFEKLYETVKSGDDDAPTSYSEFINELKSLT